MLLHFLSFLGGIIASAIVWFITSKVSRVKIEFSRELMGDTDPLDTSKYHYNIEVHNKGKGELIDLHMQAKIIVEGADRQNPGLRCFALLNLDYFCNFPSLSYQGSKDKLWPRKHSGRLIYAINMAGAYEEFRKSYYVDNVIEKAKSCTLQLDDIFYAYPDAAIQFYLFGYDSFTGARKMYKSKYYRKADIRFLALHK